LAGALVGGVLAGCGASSHSAPSHAVKSASQVPAVITTVKAPPPTTPTTQPPPAPPPPSPAFERLRAALLAQLAAAGAGSGAVVYDLTAHQQLFWLRGNVARPPASVEKLYTTVAVLKNLGTDARLQTTVLGAGHLGRGGVWEGNLYLHGGGDPTFGDGAFNRIWEHGYGPTAVQLVAQLHRLGIRAVTGRVVGDASLFDHRPGGPNTGYAPDIPDLGGQLAALTYDHGATSGALSPAAFAAKELVLTMRDDGISARAARFAAATPPGAQRLASVESPPMSVLLWLMDVPSDDFFAEMLAKQLGVRFGGAGTTAAGAAVISSAVAALGVHPAIVDGSGLSRRDLSSPAQIVDLLRAVWGTPTGQLLRASLPTVGENGTVRTIAVRTPAHGHCLAKTGTLNFVTNLAGYCQATDGHTLAFAMFVDGPPNSEALVPIGRMAAAIARY
jgi:D-alanyl-D-alanine carboxypeptidase/D-alanyl-D-alanine-endopeptidase (penicillin-binding protein 4)